jgi:hypothetical protein
LRVGSGIIGSVLIISSLAIGTAVTALESVPGQPIYPVKKLVENVQMQLASGETEKANLQIKFANNRLEELEIVLEKNKQGKISEEQVQKVVEKTIQDVAQTTNTISQKNSEPTAENPPVQLLAKIVDLSNKQTALLQTATIHSEGQVKINLEKALVESKVTQEKAIENIEKAGLKVEGNPITIEETTKETANQVSAKGKLTQVTTTGLNIGTARFLLTNDTKFVNIIEPEELKIDQIVEIKGEIKDGKTYALTVTVEKAKAEPQPETGTTEEEDPEETPAPEDLP